MVSRATQTVDGLADALMVAHLGPSALAATTAGANNTFLVLILPMGCVFIVQSFAAQLYGKGDVIGARRFAGYGLLLALVAQLAAMVAIPGIDPLLALFDYEADVREPMAAYMAMRMLSTGAATGLEALGAYYGGVGRTRVPMIANLVAMVLNIVCNAIFIDGLLGAPAMGVEGAALSSTIASTAAFVGLLAYFLREGRLPAPRAEELLRTIRFGLPSGLNWFFEFFAFNLFVNVVVAGLGTPVLAALMAVMQINAVSFMPAFALGSSGAILVGQAIGRDDRDDVPRLVRLTFGTTATWQGLVGLTYLIAPALLIAPFARDEPTLAEVGARMLMISACWQLFDSGATVLAEALRAAGDTAWPLGARLVLAWLVFVPGSWISVRVLGGGDIAAMVWLTLYLALLALLLVFRFRTGVWRTLEITEPELAH